MRVNLKNIAYAVGHPFKTLRYVWRHDRISYRDIDCFLPPNPVILEAGAHSGSNTVEMAEFWPHASIYAFEPVPGAFHELQERVCKLRDRVKTYREGLGPLPASMTMYLSGDGSAGSCQSSSLLKPTIQQTTEFSFVTFNQTIEIPVTTMDIWAEENRIDKVDFMWLDMQGYELEALRGADRLLRSVSAVHMEISNIELYEKCPLYPEVKRWMRGRGLVPQIEATFRVGGNVLFARRQP